MTTAIRLLIAGAGVAFGAPAQVVTAFTTSQNGGWTQAGGPRVIAGGGITVFGYVDLGTGNIEVISVPDGSVTPSAAFTLHAALEQDTHAAPAIIFRPDGRIVAMYSAHNGAQMYVRVSSNPYDISAWDTEQTLDATLGGRKYTYPMLSYLGTDLYGWYRDRPSADTNSALAYTVSTNDGASWSAQTIAYQNGTNTETYWSIDSDGSRFDIAVIDDRTASPESSIYHFTFDGTTYRKSDGTSAGSAPLDPTDLTLVYDGADGLGWPFDIVSDATNPAFVYAVVDSGSTNSWRHARWDGSAWDLHTIASSGGFIDSDGEGNVYAASVSLDHEDPNVAYANVKVGSHWEVQQFTTSDLGVTWAKTADLTSGSSDDNLYVTTVRDHNGRRIAFWLYGAYTGSPPYVHATLGVKGWG